MADKIVIKNVFLNAITYHYCYNLPLESVKKLSIKYRRMLASEAKTKVWCERSSMDEKIAFFNAIGLHTGISIFPDKIKSGVSLKEILTKYENEKMAAAQSEQANLGCYVTTDRDSAFLLGLMGMTINHQSYIKALDYTKTSYRVKNWSKVLNSPGQEEMLDVVEGAKVVANTVLNAGLVFDAITQLFEVNSNEMKILLMMYQRRQSYILREDIAGHFVGHITKARVLRAMKKLLLNGYVDKHQDWKSYQYVISTSGINMVSEFLNKIVKSNQF